MDVERLQENDTFSIKTEVFEGPLELLADLIEKRKLLINDISLAAVTDEYMQYVAMLERQSLKETVHFVVVASTLLLIKSKSLLPVFDLTEEEEGNIEDLQERLKLYKIFKDAAHTIGEQYGVSPLYERRFIRDETPLFLPDAYCSKGTLLESLQGVLEGLPEEKEKPKVRVKSAISLEEMLNNLQKRVERQMKFRFNEFAGEDRERTTVIVGFLAVLEMVKQGTIIVNQIEHFDDIEIERESGGIPRYI